MSTRTRRHPVPGQGVLFGHLMCAPCRSAWAAWLDYRLPAPITICTIGNRPKDAEMRRQSRFRQWQETVRAQQALIEQLCAAGRCEGSRAT